MIGITVALASIDLGLIAPVLVVLLIAWALVLVTLVGLGLTALMIPGSPIIVMAMRVAGLAAVRASAGRISWMLLWAALRSLLTALKVGTVRKRLRARLTLAGVGLLLAFALGCGVQRLGPGQYTVTVTAKSPPASSTRAR